MKAQILATVATAALLAGCTTAYGEDLDTMATPSADAAAIPSGTGYFAADSTLPFNTPDFSKISEDDYIPAFEQGMAIQKAEIQAIIDNPAPPTMENTIVALEKSGRMLGRVARVEALPVSALLRLPLRAVGRRRLGASASLSDQCHVAAPKPPLV